MVKHIIGVMVFALSLFTGYAQNVPVSSLPATDTLGQKDFFPLVQGGHYKKAFISQLAPHGRPKCIPYFSPSCRLITDTFFQRDSATSTTVISTALGKQRTAMLKTGNLDDTVYGTAMILGYNPATKSNINAIVGVADMSPQGLDSFSAILLAHANNNAGSTAIIQRYQGMIFNFQDTDQVNQSMLLIRPYSVLSGCQNARGSNILSIDTNGLHWQYRDQYLYTFPNNRGTLGQTLITDGSGNLSWQNTAGGAGGGWSLTGNSGTNAGANFVGTTDAQPLQFKVNGVTAGWLNDNKILSGNTSYGWNANPGNKGNYNITVGLQALANNSSASNDIAIGNQALINDGLGGYNIAIGTNALSAYSTYLHQGSIAIGTNSLLTNATGVQLTAIGHYADIIKDGITNAAVIGYNARVGCSNCGVLGDTTTLQQWGIGYSTPAAQLGSYTGLAINGKIVITDGTQGAGKALTSDANGLATWQNAATGVLPAYPGNASALAALGPGQYYVSDGSTVTSGGPAKGVVMQTY